MPLARDSTFLFLPLTERGRKRVFYQGRGLISSVVQWITLGKGLTLRLRGFVVKLRKCLCVTVRVGSHQPAETLPTDEPPHDTLLGSDPGSDCSAPCLCVPAAEDGEAFSLGPCAKPQGLWRNSTRGVDESGVVRPSSRTSRPRRSETANQGEAANASGRRRCNR